MKTCPEDLADRQMPRARRRAVQRHVKGCAACREELAAVAKTRTALRAAVDASVPDDFRRRTLEKMPSPKPASRRPVFAIAGVAVVAVGTFAVLYTRSEPTSGKRADGVMARAFADHQIEDPNDPFQSHFKVQLPENLKRKSDTYIALGGERDSNDDGVALGASRDVSLQYDADANAMALSGKGIPRAYAEGSIETVGHNRLRSVHQEAMLGLSVRDVEAGCVDAERLIGAVKGYVDESEITTAGGGRYATLNLRIPVSAFDETMERLGKLGRIEARNLKRKDLTATITEKSAAAQAAESRARELETKLKRAQSERREAQRETKLDELRSAVDSARSELRAARAEADYATVTLALHENAPVATPDRFAELRATKDAAAKAFTTAVRVPVILLIWTAAFAPIWLPLAIWWRVSGRRRG